MEGFLFYTLAAVLVVFSILTVTAKNPVRSAISLISALLSMAGLFFLLGAEFVGAVQILVYVGGIMVLFLFVIMLVRVGEVQRQPRTSRRWKTAMILTAVLAIELAWVLFQGGEAFQPGPARGVIEGMSSNTESLGWLLYYEYLLPFEIASVLLLVALVGAVVLAKKEL